MNAAQPVVVMVSSPTERAATMATGMTVTTA